MCEHCFVNSRQTSQHSVSLGLLLLAMLMLKIRPLSWLVVNLGMWLV